MEAICSSETSVATQQTTRRHIPEDDTLHSHRSENLKSYTVTFYLQFFVSVSDEGRVAAWEPEVTSSLCTNSP
jgi:hypothetical protein